MWFDLIEWVKAWPLAHKLLDPEDLDLLYVTRNGEEAFTVIQRAYENYRDGSTEFCLHTTSTSSRSIRRDTTPRYAVVGIIRRRAHERGDGMILTVSGLLLPRCPFSGLLACHLAGIAYSSSDSQFWEYNCHKYVPDCDYTHNKENIRHGSSPL